MPLTWKDRIKVAVASGGTGTLTLGSAASGYRTFAAGDDGKLFPYVIENGTAWETGYGTYTHSGTTFARTTRTDSSSGAAIDAGTGNLYVDLVAGVADRTNLGVLENVTGSDAATTMVVGNMYVVDMSAWATADRTYTLPTTAAVGSRIGILISSGNTSTFELDITAATSDTLNGVAGGTVWSRLFITGECVIMRCVTADSAWIVEYDGRIPQVGVMRLSTSASSETSATWTPPTSKSGVWTADVNVGSVCGTANDKITVRRAGYYGVTVAGISGNSMSDTDGFGAGLWKNGTVSGGGSLVVNPSIFLGAAGYGAVVNGLMGVPLAAGDYLVYHYYVSSASAKGLLGSASPRLSSAFSVTEVL